MAALETGPRCYTCTPTHGRKPRDHERKREDPSSILSFLGRQSSDEGGGSGGHADDERKKKEARQTGRINEKDGEQEREQEQEEEARYGGKKEKNLTFAVPASICRAKERKKRRGG